MLDVIIDHYFELLGIVILLDLLVVWFLVRASRPRG